MHIPQPKIPAGVVVVELLVIEPEQVQDGRVQVVHLHRVFGRLEAEITGRAMNMPALHAAAGRWANDCLDHLHDFGGRGLLAHLERCRAARRQSDAEGLAGLMNYVSPRVPKKDAAVKIVLPA